MKTGEYDNAAHSGQKDRNGFPDGRYRNLTMKHAAGRKTGKDLLTVGAKINNAAHSGQKDRKEFPDGQYRNLTMKHAEKDAAGTGADTDNGIAS